MMNKNKVSPLLQDFENPRIRNKILNPNQQQQLEDTRRFREKITRLREDKFGSASELYIRKKEKEDDVEMLDKYDSFYETTKSLLMLFQIMGIMPITRKPRNVKGPRTTFNFLSSVSVWAYFIYSCETIIVVYVARERIIQFFSNSDSTTRFDATIYNIIFMSLMLPHFVLPLASWRSGNQVAVFKNMWTNYQLKFFRVTGKVIRFPRHYVITWFLCIFSWALSFFIIMSQHYFQPDFALLHTFAYFHIIAMLNGFCSLWYVNCTAFGYVSSLLLKSLEETIQLETPAAKVMELRHLWVDLSQLMQQLGKAYSKMYGIYCLVVFFTTIIATYGALSEIIDHGATYKEFGLFIIVFYCMSLLFIICNEAHHASRKVGNKFRERLLNINSTAIDKDTLKEVEIFLNAINKNPPTMNLDGYADINRSLITSNITFMATYLVVLMQFKLTLLRTAARQAIMEAKLHANQTESSTVVTLIK